MKKAGSRNNSITRTKAGAERVAIVSVHAYARSASGSVNVQPGHLHRGNGVSCSPDSVPEVTCRSLDIGNTGLWTFMLRDA